MKISEMLIEASELVGDDKHCSVLSAISQVVGDRVETEGDDCRLSDWVGFPIHSALCNYLGLHSLEKWAIFNERTNDQIAEAMRACGNWELTKEVHGESECDQPRTDLTRRLRRTCVTDDDGTDYDHRGRTPVVDSLCEHYSILTDRSTGGELLLVYVGLPGILSTRISKRAERVLEEEILLGDRKAARGALFAIRRLTQTPMTVGWTGMKWLIGQLREGKPVYDKDWEKVLS